MFARTAICALVLSLGALGCADPSAPRVERRAPIGVHGDAIINGQIDTTHDAVVAVFFGNNKCSGTIVDVNGGFGYALTAAHCIKQNAASIVIGDDHDAGGVVEHSIVEAAVHPYYNDFLYDMAVVKFSGASGSTPVIPALTPSEDTLHDTSTVTFVGFGLTSHPNGDTSQRHQRTHQLSALRPLTLEYNQDSGGPCSGDSGGAVLTTGATERVAGIIANTGEGCTDYGTSGRVSEAYDGFIAPYVNTGTVSQTDAAPQTCDQCNQWATSGNSSCVDEVEACYASSLCLALLGCWDTCLTLTCQAECAQSHPLGYEIYTAITDCVCDGACVSQCSGDAICDGFPDPTTSSSTTIAAATTAGAGGSGVGATAGAGGAPATDDGWVAGNAKRDSVRGVILSSCDMSARAPARSSGWWLWLVASVLIQRRRCA